MLTSRFHFVSLFTFAALATFAGGCSEPSTQGPSTEASSITEGCPGADDGGTAATSGTLESPCTSDDHCGAGLRCANAEGFNPAGKAYSTTGTCSDGSFGMPCYLVSTGAVFCADGCYVGACMSPSH